MYMCLYRTRTKRTNPSTLSTFSQWIFTTVGSARLLSFVILVYNMFSKWLSSSLCTTCFQSGFRKCCKTVPKGIFKNPPLATNFEHPNNSLAMFGILRVGCN